MGRLIPRTAGPDRIFEDFTETLDQARLKGGEIKSVVEARLGPMEAGVASAMAEVEAAEKAADDGERALLAVDGASDLEVGAVVDEIWNALGRPASSIELTLIAGRGKSEWTDGDPRQQHLLMAVLADRIRKTSAASLQAGKEGWAQRIEAKATAQEQAASDLVKSEAKVTVSGGIARATANLAQVALTRTKRDLMNAGLTEAQIHAIIPDYQPKPRKKAKPEPKEPKAEASDGKSGGAAQGDGAPPVAEPVAPVAPTPADPAP